MNDYNILCEQADALLFDENDMIVAMANISAAIFNELSDLNWAGFYRVLGDKLVLGPFQGKVACTRIQKGKGVCGKAYKDAQTVVVPDVHQFPGHIACDSASNSEIVVPLKDRGGNVFAVLDIDSIKFDRFTEEDKVGLEKIAFVLEKVYEREQMKKVPVPEDKAAELKLPEKVTDLSDVYELLSKAWCESTCAPRLQSNWKPENAALGQCSITAFLLQDIFGGEVFGMKTKNGTHCYNRIDGKLFDLTASQFGADESKLVYDIENDKLQDRESSEHFQKLEKKERYELLWKKIRKEA